MRLFWEWRQNYSHFVLSSKTEIHPWTESAVEIRGFGRIPSFGDKLLYFTRFVFF